MNDSEMFDRLQRIDPLHERVHITPAHSAQALTLMERIMTTELKDPMGDHAVTTGPVLEEPRTSRRSRHRWYAAASVGAAAAVAAAITLPGLSGSSAALAWTPTPRAATEADADAARQACLAPEESEPQPVDVGSRGSTAVPAAPTPAPVVLGSLAALDVRGSGGLAVFTSDEGVVMCMLQVVDGTPKHAGMIATGVADQSTGTLAVEGGMTTGVGTNTAVTMLTGQAGAAAQIQIDVAGLEPITATLVDGRFAAWWPEQASSSSTSLVGTITIRAFAADGTEIAALDWTGVRSASDTADGSRSFTP